MFSLPSKITGKFVIGKFLQLALLAFLITTPRSAHSQNDQSNLIGFEGDGVALTGGSTASGQIVLAHINELTGELRVNVNQSGAWSTEVLAPGFGADSAISVATSGEQVLVAAVNSNSGTLTYFSKFNNAWIAELVAPSGVRGKPGISPVGADVVISYSDIAGKDLIVARRSSNRWTKTVVDMGIDSVGAESAVTLNATTIAVAYSDESNRQLKVATQVVGKAWAIEAVSYPTAQFGRFPSVRYLADNSLSILSGDVIQDNTVGGKGVFHAMKRPNMAWDMEHIGVAASMGQIGVFTGTGINAAFLARNGGYSSLSGGALEYSGLWGGRVAFSSNAEKLSNLFAARDNAGVLQIFSRSTSILNGKSLIRQVGAVINGGTSLPPITVNPTPRFGGPDTDGDGLSDSYEAELGTNPRAVDTDGDGISDGQEIDDETNPLDRGNFADLLGTKVCVPWAKRSSTIATLEIENHSESAPLSVTFTLYSNKAKVGATANQVLQPLGAYSLSITDFAKPSRFAYGLVCAQHNGVAGQMSGKYVEALKATAPVPARLKAKVKSAKGTVALLSQNLQNARPGAQVLSYKLVAASRVEKATQYITFSNIEKTEVQGTIKSIDSKGAVKYTYKVKIPANGTALFRGNELRLQSSGKLDWAPTKSSLKVRIVFEQQLEEKKKSAYSVSKLARQDGRMK